MTGVNRDIKITTLAENTVYGKGLQGEHGLSLLVEVGGHKVLFDTGASDLFIRNARLMGIDLREVDCLVLSHGHRDHTGGLHHFLRLNDRAQVVCKREVLCPKYKDERENGLMHPEDLDTSRFRFVEQTEEVLPGVFVFPQLPVADEADTHFEHFYTLTDGQKRPDRFDDELALVLKRDLDLAVLSACSHRGITNILRTVHEAFPAGVLKLVLGGFHIRTAGVGKYSVIARYLSDNLPQRLGVCHCTGVDQYALFHQSFADRLFYSYTGWVETF